MANALDRNELFSFAESHRDEYEALLKRLSKHQPSPAIRRTRKTFAKAST